MQLRCCCFVAVVNKWCPVEHFTQCTVHRNAECRLWSKHTDIIGPTINSCRKYWNWYVGMFNKVVKHSFSYDSCLWGAYKFICHLHVTRKGGKHSWLSQMARFVSQTNNLTDRQGNHSSPCCTCVHWVMTEQTEDSVALKVFHYHIYVCLAYAVCRAVHWEPCTHWTPAQKAQLNSNQLVNQYLKCAGVLSLLICCWHYLVGISSHELELALLMLECYLCTKMVIS